jgi:hypothetical protein
VGVVVPAVPCRAEFPIFQRLAEKYAGRVAFLGVDMQDGREAALAFMGELPTPYPHYFDEDTSISRLFGGGRVSPTTGFYDARGKLVFTHLGAYPPRDQLLSSMPEPDHPAGADDEARRTEQQATHVGVVTHAPFDPRARRSVRECLAYCARPAHLRRTVPIALAVGLVLTAVTSST